MSWVDPSCKLPPFVWETMWILETIVYRVSASVPCATPEFIASWKITSTSDAMSSFGSLALATWESMNTRLLREAAGLYMVNLSDYGFYAEALREGRRFYIALKHQL